jgi:hypothetical protein
LPKGYSMPADGPIFRQNARHATDCVEISRPVFIHIHWHIREGGLNLRASPPGIELEGSPIERFPDNVIGMEQREFGGAESGVRRLAALQFVVEAIH